MIRFFEQFVTVIWLRQKLLINSWRRHGLLNLILLLSFSITALIGSMIGFTASLTLGSFLFQQVTPDQIMYGITAGTVIFLVIWIFGVLTDLQQTESLSLENLLHLPMSLTGVFLINYFRSWLSLTLAMTVPPMVGLSVAMVIAYGWELLIAMPLLLSFLLMITGVTHLFRGWVAELMANKRRKNTILASIVIVIVLLSQLPMMLQMAFMRNQRSQNQNIYQQELDNLYAKINAGTVSPQDVQEQMNELSEKAGFERRRQSDQQLKDIGNVVKTTARWLPITWQAHGIRAAIDGRLLPGVLCSLGMFTIAALALWRSYIGTLRIYRGTYTSAKAISQRAEAPAAEVSNGKKPKWKSMMTWELPFLSETTTTITLGSLRSLLRAPESKVLLISPLIFVCIFVGIILGGVPDEIPEQVYRVIPPAGCVFALFTMMQILQNQFGYDRAGFRVFVLAPVDRRDVLLGKNLAIAPLMLTTCLALSTAATIAFPVGVWDFFANVMFSVVAFLLFCLPGNAISILAPIAMKPGSLAGANPSFITFVIQFVAYMLFPFLLLPMAAPLAVDILLKEFEIISESIPLYFLLLIVELPLIALLYLWVMKALGHLLEKRELRILEIVAQKVE
ncbi:MAG: hypothetical protein CMJ78_16455 [Planctomycetaceae bacterium]|nr:hypothetical protein [Planctomycetaceae bacterium]